MAGEGVLHPGQFPPPTGKPSKRLKPPVKAMSMEELLAEQRINVEMTQAPGKSNRQRSAAGNRNQLVEGELFNKHRLSRGLDY